MITLFIGSPGAGKSFLAERLETEYFIGLPDVSCSICISSDKMREVISGDENNQDCSREAFRTMELMADYLMSLDFDVLIDATNKTRKSRKQFKNLAKKHKVKFNCIWLKTPLDECLRRNKLRSRQVPDNVITSYFEKFEEPTLEEFDNIYTC